MESVRVAQRRLKKIGKDSPRDPRKPQWLVHLASTYQGWGPNGITQAKLYYLRAAEMGLAEAYNFLGIMCFESRDWQQAKDYFIKAAIMYCVRSIYKLAQEAEDGCFMGQIGFKRQEIVVSESERHASNPQEALRLDRRGAKLGHPGCCFHFGMFYDSGIGTEINYAKAVKWYKIAAEKGEAGAMHKLAICYALGVEESAESIRWIEKGLEIEPDDQNLCGLLAHLQSFQR
jgi:uncharacterized protein